MLCNIDISLIEDARGILTLLYFAPRPLTIQELIDGIAVDIKNSAGLNRKRRLEGVDDIHVICPGLIDTGLSTNHTIETQRRELTVTVHIAHFSVQEYLDSERIRNKICAMYGLTSAKAHAEISQIYLIYLLEPSLSSSKLNQVVLEDYPLAHFAAMHWYHHYKLSGCSDSKITDSILKLFRQHKNAFLTWVRLHNMDQPWQTSVDFDLASNRIASPIYYASLLGLNGVVFELVNSRDQGSTPISASSSTYTLETEKRINTQGGRYGNALQAASYGGHETIAQLLVEKGADVNAQGGDYGNALLVASESGHEQVVQLLL